MSNSPNNLKTITKYEIVTKHESHILFHVIWNCLIYIYLLLLTFFILYLWFFAISPICCIQIKLLSYTLWLWKITSILSINLKLKLQLSWADPRYLPVIWQWPLTLTSDLLYCLSQTWHLTAFFSNFRLHHQTFSMLYWLKCVLIIFLQYYTSSNIFP